MGRRLGQIAVPIAVLGVIAALSASHAGDVGAAIRAVPAWSILVAVTLHVACLVLRSEAWGLSIAAIERRPLPRRIVHRANGAAFVAGAVQSQAALPARVAMLRRLAGDRAPRPAQIAVADVPIFAVELLLTAALLVLGVLAGLGPWWTAPAAVGFAFAVLAALVLLRRRFAHRPLVRGLAVLADRRRRARLLALAGGICGATVTRLWLILLVCGLPHGLGEVGWLFAALGAFGLLPAGPGAPAGATLATLGAANIGATVAAGIVLSATSIVAVLIYGACATIVGSVAARRDGLSAPAGDAEAHGSDAPQAPGGAAIRAQAAATRSGRDRPVARESGRDRPEIRLAAVQLEGAET
jgi:hypothetical protein